MNFLSELTYGTLSGGLKNGFLMYELVCNGADPTDDASIAAALGSIRSHGAHCKRVNIAGTLPSPGTMFTLLRSLRAVGFDVFAETSSQACPSWHDFENAPRELISFLSVRLSSPLWAPYPFHELIYTIESAETPEPSMPEGFNDRFAPLFLDGAPLKTMLAFARKSAYRWNINSRIKPAKEYLYKEGQE
jgi:hypothetical protein